MHDRRTSLAEALGAVRTRERLFLVVEALVRDEITVPDVTLAALRAPVRLSAAVDVQVPCQIASLDERLATYLAAESLIFLLL